MADRPLSGNKYVYTAAYFGVMAVLLLLHVVPLSVGPGRLPGPDLLLIITIAWVLRRPHYVPMLLVAAVFLLADMVLMRPPGLWAALVVTGVEFLRVREPTVREASFPAEWAMVAAVLLAMTLAYVAILTVLLVDYAGLGLILLQYLGNVAAYPLVVALSRNIFGVTKMTPTQTDARGRPR